jgi:hypothetical protein
MNSAMEFPRIVQTESLLEKVSFGIRPSFGTCPGSGHILGGCPGAAGFLVYLTTDSSRGWYG